MTSTNFEEKFFRRIIFKVILLFILVNLVISSVLYVLHVNSLEEDLLESIIEKSRTVGNSVVNILENAIKYGIPLHDINGGTEFLNNKVKYAKDLDYIIVTDEEGKIVAQSDVMNQLTSSEEDNNTKALQGKFMSFSRIQNGLNIKPEPFNVYSYTNIPLQIKYQNQLYGYVHVGISHQKVNENIIDIFYDIAIIIFVALIIGYEFLNYIFRNAVIQPMQDFMRSLKQVINRNFSTITSPRTSDLFGEVLQKLNENIISLNNLFIRILTKFKNLKESNDLYQYIKDNIREIRLNFNFKDEAVQVQPIQPIVSNLRLILFLVSLCEALIITSIPTYSGKFYQANFVISKTTLSALPVIVNMLFVGLFIPVVPLISYRTGFRKAFILGTWAMLIGYLIAFMSDTLIGLLVSRAITGCGFSLCYVCCQNYVAAYANEETRTKSYTIYNVAQGAGYLCGFPIGGILVDNISDTSIFLCAGLLSSSIFFIARKYIVDLPFVTLTKKREVKKSVWSLLKLPELMIPMIFSVLPTRFLYSAVIFFLYPIYLTAMHNSASTIGRIMMIFGLISFIFAPQAYKVVAKVSSPNLIAPLSSCIVAIPMIVDPIFKSTTSVIVQLIINTLCTMVYIVSMMIILDKISKKYYQDYTKSSILSCYFIAERIGMIMGPGIATLILAHTDYSHTLSFIGFILIACNAIYILQSSVSHLQQKKCEVC